MVGKRGVYKLVEKGFNGWSAGGYYDKLGKRLAQDVYKLGEKGLKGW